MSNVARLFTRTLVAINNTGILTVIMGACGRRETCRLSPQSNFYCGNYESRAVEPGHAFLHGEQALGIGVGCRAGHQSNGYFGKYPPFSLSTGSSPYRIQRFKEREILKKCNLANRRITLEHGILEMPRNSERSARESKMIDANDQQRCSPAFVKPENKRSARHTGGSISNNRRAP